MGFLYPKTTHIHNWIKNKCRMKIIFIKKVKMYTMNKYQYNQTSVMCIVCIKQ